MIRKVLAGLSFAVFGLLLAYSVFLLGSSAVMFLIDVYASMSPDSDGTLPASWCQVALALGLSLLTFLCSWLFLAAGVGMLLRRGAKK